VAKFKYLGMRVTDQNLIQEEIRGYCYHSVQSLLLSGLSKSITTRKQKTIILPVKLGLWH
jgi:hypothetical protein